MATLLLYTAMAAGSDAFETVLVFYKCVRMGAQLGDKEAEKVLVAYNEVLVDARKSGASRIQVT